MRYGASTFIWVSPFSSKTLNLLDKAKAFGFDIVEICVEDPDMLNAASIRARADKAGVALTVCGAFGPSRDLSSEAAAVRGTALAYLKRCIDYAALLGSPFVSGPMYAAVGATASERAAQWARRRGPQRSRGLRGRMIGHACH
jgi:D-psicose/D-tagatose/L-ribulose 3-epimerase